MAVCLVQPYLNECQAVIMDSKVRKHTRVKRSKQNDLIFDI